MSRLCNSERLLVRWILFSLCSFSSDLFFYILCHQPFFSINFFISICHQLPVAAVHRTRLENRSFFNLHKKHTQNSKIYSPKIPHLHQPAHCSRPFPPYTTLHIQTLHHPQFISHTLLPPLKLLHKHTHTHIPIHTRTTHTRNTHIYLQKRTHNQSKHHIEIHSR